ncbi:MAG: hypothetical protein LBT49_03515 [Prevotellaceae bacterium]|jgi:hypothetical protein|nr:hypothetical protein [Prevotellaceae bacterium]
MATKTTKKASMHVPYETMTKAEDSKKLSKAGKWLREHPHGRGDVIVYDRSILY